MREKEEFNEEENEFHDSETFFPDSENEKPKEDEEPQLPITVTMDHPFDFGKKNITEIVFVRRPNGSSMAHFPANDKYQKLGHFYPILAHMSDYSGAVINKMTTSDIRKCIETLNPFL